MCSPKRYHWQLQAAVAFLHAISQSHIHKIITGCAASCRYTDTDPSHCIRSVFFLPVDMSAGPKRTALAKCLETPHYSLPDMAARCAQCPVCYHHSPAHPDLLLTGKNNYTAFLNICCICRRLLLQSIADICKTHAQEHDLRCVPWAY